MRTAAPDAHVLLVEGDDDHALLAEGALAGTAVAQFTVERAGTCAEVVALLCALSKTGVLP